MSQVIDERVVEMRFDNKDFEKNIGQSIDSLDRLKQALKIEDTSKSIEKISTSLEKINTINFDALNNAASAITKKFSFVGTIIDQLRRNMVNLFTARGAIKDAIGFATEAITGGGERRAANLAKAKFSLSAIVGEGKELDAVMASVGDSVDGTAYSLDEAAGVAANLVTIGYRGGDKLTNMLKGIAGVASMAGANFMDIGNIFSKVAAKGHLMGDQVNQLAYRNINVVELLARKYGKTGDEITKMVSKGEISFSMFADTLQEAFGEHAAKANETYSGSLANLRSAFARIGADVAATKMEALKDVFNALRPLVNELRKDLAPFTTLLTKSMMAISAWAVEVLKNPLWNGVIKNLTESLFNVFYTLIQVFRSVKAAFGDIFPEISLKGFLAFTEVIKNLTSSLVITEERGNNVRRTFKGLFTVLKALTSIFRSTARAAGPLIEIFITIVNGVMAMTAALGDGIVALSETLETTDVLAKGFKFVAGVIKSVLATAIGTAVLGFEAIREAIESTSEQFDKGTEGASSFVSKIIEAFKEAGGGAEGFMEVLKLLYHTMQQTFAEHPVLLNALETIKKAFITVTEVVKNSTGTILTVLNELASGKGLIIIFSIAIIMLVRRMDKFADGITTTVTRVNGALGALQATLHSGKSVLDSFKASLATDNFLKVAAGIGLIAVSLTALTYAITDTDLAKFVVITAALSVFVGVTLGLSKQQTTISGAIVSLVALTGAVALIAGIFKMLENINFGGTGRVVREVMLLTGLLAYLAGMAYLLRRLNVKFASGAGTIAILSASLIMIASSLLILGEVNAEYLLDKVLAFGAVLTAMVAIAMYVQNMPVWKGFTFLAVAGAMALAADAIVKIFNGIDLSALKDLNVKLELTAGQFIALGGVLALLALVLAKLEPFIMAISINIASIGLAFLLVAIALKVFPTYYNDFINGIATIAVMVTALAALIATIYAFNRLGAFTDKASTKSLFGLAAAITAIGAAMFAIATTAALLSMVDPATLFAPIIALGAISIMIMGIVERLQGVENASKSLIALTGLIGLMSGLMVAFSVIAVIPGGGKSLLIGWAVLASIVVLAMELIEVVSKIKGTTWQDVAVLGVVFGAIFALVSELGYMSTKTDPNNVVKVAGIMSVLTAIILGFLGPLVKSLNSFSTKKFNFNVLAQLITIFAGLIILVGMTSKLASHNYAQIVAAGLTVGALTALVGTGLVPMITALASLNKKQFNWNIWGQMATIFAGLIILVGMTSKLASHNYAQIVAAGLTVGALTALVGTGLVPMITALASLNKKQFNVNVLAQMGAMFLGLTLLVGATAALATNPPAQILLAGAVMAAMVVLMDRGFIPFIQRLNAVPNGSINFKMLATFGALALSITAIIHAMSELAAREVEKVGTTFVVAVATIGIFAAAISIFNRMQNIKGALVGAASILILTFALRSIVNSLLLLTDCPWDKIKGSVIGAAAVLAELSAIILIAGVIGKDAMSIVSMLVAGGSLLLATLGLAALAAALSSLTQYDFKSIIAATVGMMGVLTVLGVILTILTGISVGTEGLGAVVILVVAAALAALGVACGIAAVGIGAAAAGIAFLVNALKDLFSTVVDKAPAVGDGIVYVAKSVATTMTIMADAVVDSVARIKVALADLKVSSAGLGGDFVGGFVHSITGGAGLAFDAAAALCSAALSGIQTTQDSNSPAKATIALAIDFFGGFVQTICGSNAITGALNAGKMLAGGAISGLQGNLSGAQTAGESIMDMFNFGLKAKGAEAVSTAASIKNQVLAILRGSAMGEWGTDTFSYGSNDSALIKVASSQIKDKKVREELLKKNAEKRMAQAKKVAEESGFGWLADMTKPFEDVTKVMEEAGDAADGAGKSLGGAGKAAKQSGVDAKHALKGWQELESTLSDTIDSQMDIFSEFDKKTELTGEKLLANMRSQVEGVAEWAYNMQKLSARGLNSVLLQELSQLGPQGYEKVNAFMQMTDEQLQEANQLYAQRLAMPDRAAEAVVAGFAEAGMWATEGFTNALDYLAAKDAGAKMGSQSVEGLLGPDGIDAGSPSKKTEEAGGWFGEGMDIGLRNAYWLTRIQAAGSQLGETAITGLMQALDGNTDLSGTSESAIASFISGIVDMTGELTGTAATLCQQFIEIMTTELPEQTFYDFGFMVFTKFSEGLTKSNEALSKELPKMMKKLEKTIGDTFEKIGEFAAKGMSKGIEKKIKDIQKSTLKATKAAETAATGKKGLDEKSPSKKFFRIGEYATIGLANGIVAASSQATNSMTDVSTQIVSKLQNAIDKSQSYMGSISDDMVLTPVLDLSMIEEGLDSATSLFSGRNVSLGASFDNARLAAMAFNRMQTPAEPVNTEPQTINNYTTFNQTNTSPKALSNSEIYRKTNNMISRFRNK